MGCGICWVETGLVNRVRHPLGFPFILHSFLLSVVLFRVYVFLSLVLMKVVAKIWMQVTSWALIYPLDVYVAVLFQ